MVTLPLPYLLAELALFAFFASRFGFGPTFLAYALPSVLGFVLLTFQSRSALFTLQSRLAQGDRPGLKVMSTGAKVLGAILLIVPLFSTRVVGVLLTLPGTRHLMIFLFQAWIFRRFAAGFRGFGAGAGPGPGGFRGSFRTFHFDGQGFREAGFEAEERVEREAQVVDVTPLEIEHSTPRSPDDEKIP